MSPKVGLQTILRGEVISGFAAVFSKRVARCQDFLGMFFSSLSSYIWSLRLLWGDKRFLQLQSPNFSRLLCKFHVAWFRSPTIRTYLIGRKGALCRSRLRKGLLMNRYDRRFFFPAPVTVIISADVRSIWPLCWRMTDVVPGRVEICKADD